MKNCLGWTLISCATTVALLAVSHAYAQNNDIVMRSGEFADDVFVSGGNVSVNARVLQDLFVAGGKVDVSATVTGDVYVAGGKLDLDTEVSGNLFAAGGKLKLDGKIKDGVVVFGGKVVVDADIEGDVLLTAGKVDVIGSVKGDVRGGAGKFVVHHSVDGNVLLGGGKVELRDTALIKGKATIGAGKLYAGGHIEHGLKAGAREIVIAGVIDGDVELVANEITLLPSARIGGDFVYRSPQAIEFDDSVQVGGDVTYIQSEEVHRGMGDVFVVVGKIYLILVSGLILVAAVFILVAPPLLPSIDGRIRAHKWKALGFGLTFMIGVPIVMTLLTVSAVGLPLAVIMSAIYFLFVATGLFGASYAFGQKTLALFKLDFRTKAWKQVAAAACGWVIMGLVAITPVAGVVLILLATAFGVGALLHESYILCRRRIAAT